MGLRHSRGAETLIALLQASMIRNVADSANHLLLIDTCGAAGSLALAVLRPEAHVVGRVNLPACATSERLLPAIPELLANHGLALARLAGIGIVNGPGSFTGVRVGLSAAKGLCGALSIPMIAISRLAVLAGKSARREVLALLDAGREEFYAGHYVGGERLREALVRREQVLALTAQGSSLQCVACEDAVVTAFSGGVEIVGPITASDVLPQVLPRFCAGRFDDVAGTDANYVRRTDLEIFAKQVRQPVAP